MNRLFASLYLDEDVDVLVAQLVTSHGFDAITSRDAGQLGRNDEEQLAYAVEHKRAFVTHNRTHFEALAEQHFAASLDHFGIIIAVRRVPHEIARRLLVILNDMTADEMKNQLIYI